MNPRKTLSDDIKKEIVRIERRKNKVGFLKRDTLVLRNLFEEYIGPEEIVDYQIYDRQRILSKMGIDWTEFDKPSLYIQNLKSLEYLPKRMSEEELMDRKKDSLYSHFLILKHAYGFAEAEVKV